METTKCDLCGSRDSSPFLHAIDRFTGAAYSYVSCSQCGLIYLNPRPGRAEMQDSYPSEYEAYELTDQPRPAGEAWRMQQALEIRLHYVEGHYPARGKLLDVGCATGSFLNLARQRGWQVTGLEIVEQAARIARERYQLEVINRDLAQADMPPASLDVATLWDVVEHLFTPKDDLTCLHAALKPGGMLFFSIPNLHSYDRRLFGSQWIGWDAPRHLNLFDNDTIMRLMADTGFEIVDQRCLLGGRGAFLLSIDRVLEGKPWLKWIQRLYPLIGALSWPYRQYAYARQRGPIIYYAARKK